MTMETIPVAVHAPDPITYEGVVGGLRRRPELTLVAEADAVVAVVVAEAVDDQVKGVLRRFSRSIGARPVLIVSDLKEAHLLEIVECGVVAVLWRREAGPDGIARAIVAVAGGDGSLPPDLQGRLLKQVARIQRRMDAQGLTATGLAEREREVLCLIADGLDTSEIAGKLAYSERTVKNVLHGLMTRFQLRNRAHAVAYALREGYI
ncbi:DNA-binding NarL/FixJ family response regulator [Actinomadura pelletieri DSM 43383]|uniref:DNA-binding NarL/FixJ family response regulator n=1 Tax=Actinomadura pelletieri DSM 43383 TaxID=1120940 RepID=A0A495QG87_9ACTN|nr:response regulator transcription factor [Actinomadura pelletieri]RKS70930.1 DNA-binding NarL/FixJ family response regulator [Actinomadura pelletieri DSM 43383]